MKGKTVVITGGTSGIGEVAAEALAQMGARIVLVARNKSRADATLARLGRSGSGVAHSVYFADLTRLAEMKRVAAEIANREPPIDVLETDGEILILIALPGVDPKDVEASLDGGTLVVSGRRVLPAELRDARILRLELPQGRFERRIPLPTGRYTITRFAAHGCIGLRLGKSS